MCSGYPSNETVEPSPDTKHCKINNKQPMYSSRQFQICCMKDNSESTKVIGIVISFQFKCISTKDTTKIVVVDVRYGDRIWLT